MPYLIKHGAHQLDLDPPAAQLLYDLGLTNESPELFDNVLGQDWVEKKGMTVVDNPTVHQLPFTRKLNKVAAQAAKVHIADMIADPNSTINTILHEYDISSDDVAMVYLSQDPYHDSFEETLNLRKFDSDRTPTSGMTFL